MKRQEPKVRSAYAIRCADGRAYVGGSTNTIERWAYHRSQLRRGVHHSRELQRAWNEKGAAAFTFEILEIVAETADLIAAEQRWMDRFGADCGLLNTYPVAGSAAGTKQSPETRAKRAEAQRGHIVRPETRAKIAASLRGSVHSEAARKKMSATRGDGRFAGQNHPQAKFTEESVRQIRAMADGGRTRAEIARLFGVSASTVSKITTRVNWGHVA